MSFDRKQEITSIFHSAIEREGAKRRAFLDGACANDEELRREVESLIASHEQAGSLMDMPAYERDARLVDEMDQGSFVGRTLAHYRIVRRLGGGGMGEVFLAEDTQLGRRVAVKILPHRLTSDSSIVARFRQEARAASALNHANIVTIYEVGESEGTHFIATEYVEGVTLRERMSRVPLTVGEALDITAQIAAALSKAHGAGVVHRDIKPENVMLDEEGDAKVLDFGIAKLVEQSRESATEAPTALKVETSPGAVMGTAHYMSPEQTRALRDIDARTDVWSLGVVLYEMLAGRLPFEGETPSDVMVAILNKEPLSLSRFNREVSEALELAVEKALAKNREDRYQTVKEMASDLRRIRQRFESGPSSPRFDDQTDAGTAETHATSLMAGAPGTDGARPDETAPVHTTSSAEYIVTEIRRHKRGIVIALVALVVIGAGVAFALYKYAGRAKPPIFQNFTFNRITTSGLAQDASISPDGKYIVYLEMTDDGSRGLYVKQTATGNVIPIVPPTKGNVLRDTSFSPDGNFVYYRFYDRENPFALYQVSSVGGTSRKLIDRCDSAAAVSPDGRKIAFTRSPGLVVANVDGTGERVVASLAEGEWFKSTGPTWSPDGKKMAIAANATVDGVDQDKLLGIDAESGAISDLSPKRWVDLGRVVWMPDGAALALMAQERTDEVGAQVWRVAYPSGEASRITNDVQARDESSLGVTADGRTLVTVTQQVLSRIETVPAGGDVSRLTRLTSAAGNGEGYSGFDLAPDGRVVFSSYEGGQFDLWIMNSDGGGRQRLTSDTHVEEDPTVSPDGRYVFFRSNRPDGAATMRLWRIDIDGGNPVQLAARVDYAPSISPDGRWVLYMIAPASDAPASEKFPSLWKLSVAGGEPVRVTDYPSGLENSSYSPDGKWIGCYFYDEQVGERYGIIPASGGRPIRHFQFPGFQYQSVRWTADSRFLSFIGRPPDPSNIWLQPAEGGEQRQLTNFKTDYIYKHAWSRDGKTLTLARGRPAFDVVLLKDNK